MNSSKVLKLDCENGVPSFCEFYGGFHSSLNFVMLVIPIMFCLTTLWIYSRNLINLIENAPKYLRSNCVSLVSIYPIASVLSLVAIMIPRAYFFCDSMSHIAFMVISYQLYR